MAKTTVTVGEFILNVLSAEQYAAAAKAGEIDPNQMYLTPEKQLVVAVSEDEYEAMKAAGAASFAAFPELSDGLAEKLAAAIS